MKKYPKAKKMRLIFISKILLNFNLICSFIILLIINKIYANPNNERPTTLVPITKGKFYCST
ncbi:hypothetical protein Mgra_00009481 [Meloidogyne graminicola]|uniref:Uncharacterized protein n=1 Tax=Meloidogyne graminicola TaxID=189291 RepID=A0A8S9Z976_9BILA|nr:hypothetical protein Mgra_00009481 [Meloidogyne graminicola]